MTISMRRSASQVVAIVHRTGRIVPFISQSMGCHNGHFSSAASQMPRQLHMDARASERADESKYGTVQDSGFDQEGRISTQKHCPTCACVQIRETMLPPSYEPLPPPFPEPKYSVHMRVLPSHLIALSSPSGRQMLVEALSASTDFDSPYWSLSEHFQNQSDPAFCGVTTLIMVLNSMSVDPQIRWRGGWRYFANEEVLLSKCCMSSERIRRVGITMDEFKILAQCQGLRVQMKRPKGIDEFRRDLISACVDIQGDSSATKIVCSFSREALGQTGEGHFSPIAAYHQSSDSALIMDVARFKYPPYWVAVHDLYKAMQPIDKTSQESRGWFLFTNPPRPRVPTSTGDHSFDVYHKEHRRPAKLVPLVGESDICPIGKIKVQFCKVASNARTVGTDKKES